jgi:hypothetical protein
MPILGAPQRLKANENLSFQGSNVLGLGFTMTPEEAQALIERNPKNKDVLFPYLNGQDLNSHPEQQPSRWVINFFDWPRERTGKGSWFALDEKAQKIVLQSGIVPADYPDPVAADYPDCLSIVRELVYPERSKNRDKQRREIWWRFTRPTTELSATIAPLRRAIVTGRVSAHHFLVIANIDQVFSDRLVVLALSENSEFALLSSTLHDTLAHRPGATTHETRNTYFPTDAFETFPFPQSPVSNLQSLGAAYHEHRAAIMRARQEGLTTTYNRFHDPGESAADIVRLRQLHVEMDHAVAASYGWGDLVLGQGVRYTISEPARREVLARLLALNHARYAEEVRDGLHEKKGSKAKGKGKRQKGEMWMTRSWGCCKVRRSHGSTWRLRCSETEGVDDVFNVRADRVYLMSGADVQAL